MTFNADKPASTDNLLTEFIPNLKANFLALAMGLDSTLTTITGTLPSGVKRYNRTSQRFEEYNGSTWGALTVKVGLADTATSMPYSGLTGTVPTWNQNTTGNAATATNMPYSGLTGTVPTWNQNTTGNAATATTAVNGVPAGAVMPFAMNSAPSGWIKANGAAVSRTTYAALFAAIGTTYGVGDGSTTFALPDLRAEFIRGFDDGRGADSGRVMGSLQAQSIESHTHGIATIAPLDRSGGSYPIPGAGTAAYSEAYGGAETRPRNVALLYCIKT